MHPAATAAESPSECRCLCGSLLARLVPEGVELRCRRCKRTLLVPLDGAPQLADPSDGTPRFTRVEERGLRDAG